MHYLSYWPMKELKVNIFYFLIVFEGCLQDKNKISSYFQIKFQ